jgi:hypothetical protein
VIAQGAGAHQDIDVSRVQKVEHTVCKDDPSTLRLSPFTG